MKNADLIAYNRRWVELHQHNPYQSQAASQIAVLCDALEAVTGEEGRDGQGAEWQRADANPAPRTITVDDVGLAYVAFMEAEGHPVSRLVAALGALGIEVVVTDDE